MFIFTRVIIISRKKMFFSNFSSWDSTRAEVSKQEMANSYVATYFRIEGGMSNLFSFYIFLNYTSENFDPIFYSCRIPRSPRLFYIVRCNMGCVLSFFG